MGNNIKKLRKEEIEKHYSIGAKLGAGSFATVKKAVRKSDGKEFAIKIIKKARLNPQELNLVHDEVEIMYKIDHPNCVQLVEIFETSKKLYMVLELLTGGELFDRIVEKGSYSEQEASSLVRDLTSAIKYLHSIGIVHRDLKPENLIYLSKDEGSVVKVTDFGLAKFKVNPYEELMTTACGTPGYVAPEVLKSEPYGPAVDMWSMGVILYILLCGFPPFYHEKTNELYKQIKTAAYSFPDPYWKNISPSAKDLVTKLLCVDPKQRFTPDQVLEHPWIAQGDASAQKFGKDHASRFRLFQARQKLRRGVQLVLVVNRISSMIKSLSQSDLNAVGDSEEAHAPVSKPKSADHNSDDEDEDEKQQS